MSQKLTTTLTNWSLVLGICVGVLGAVQAFSTIPYRLELSEKAITTLQAESRTNHDTLIRIEEHEKSMDETLKRILKRVEASVPNPALDDLRVGLTQ